MVRHKLWRYIRFKNIQTEIEAYGYHYSFSKYLILLFFGMFLVIVIGKLNGLSHAYILVLLVSIVFLLPVLLLQQFRYLYEQERFRNVTDYMEQMMYSFQKHSKIVSALEEVGELAEGEIKAQIQAVRKKIESSEMISYEEAFQKFERAYPCDRLKTMHDFFIKVERIGGQYQPALLLLLEDMKLWTERVYMFQKEQSQMKKKIVLSIFCVLILCVALFRMMINGNKMSSVINSSVYQTGTTMILILFLLVLVFSQMILTGKWLKKSQEMSKEAIIRDWKRVNENVDQYPRARKRLEREVEKQFPKWLRSMILNLQTENVYRALTESLDDAPFVLKEPLQVLVEEINENPVSMKPYSHFLKQLNVSEIHSTVKMLYAYTNTDASEAKTQLNNMMQRNMILADRAEKIQNEDEIAKYSILFYIPMFLGTGKIMLDMSMLFMVLFSDWGSLM